MNVVESISYRSEDENDNAVKCIVCEAPVALSKMEIKGMYINRTPVKLCDECKAAVLFARDMMKNRR